MEKLHIFPPVADGEPNAEKALKWDQETESFIQSMRKFSERFQLLRKDWEIELEKNEAWFERRGEYIDKLSVEYVRQEIQKIEEKIKRLGDLLESVSENTLEKFIAFDKQVEEAKEKGIFIEGNEMRN